MAQSISTDDIELNKNCNEAKEKNNSTQNYLNQSGSNDYLEKLEQIQWLRIQQRNLRIAIQCEKLKQENFSMMGKEELLEKIADLEKYLFEEVNQQNMHQNILHKLKYSDFLHKNVMMPFEQDDIKSVEKHLTENRIMHLSSMFKEKMNLSFKTAKIHKEYLEDEKNILKMQLELRDLKNKRCSLLDKLRKEGKDVSSLKDTDLKLKKEIEKYSMMIKIISRMLHLLLAYSGLNWSKDKTLLNMLVYTGKPLEKQIADFDEYVKNMKK